MKAVHSNLSQVRSAMTMIVTTVLLLMLCATSVAAMEKIAILYVYPNDVDQTKVFPQADLENHFRGPIKNFWRELSYGKYDYEPTFFRWQYPLPSAETDAKYGHYVVDMLSKKLPGGNFTIPGYVPTDYSKTLLLLGGGFRGFGGGLGSSDLKVNGVEYKKVQVGSFTYDPDKTHFFRFSYFPKGKKFTGNKNGDEINYPELGLLAADGVLLHEWGHGIGLTSHANYWRSETEPMYGEIYWWKEKGFWNDETEYGNLFDVMGSSPPKYALHVNAFYKDLAGWLEPAEKVMISESQRGIKLMPLQSQAQGVKKTAVYKIPAGQFSRPAPFDSNLDYALYIEYRQPMGFDKHLGHEYLKSNTEGLMITMNRRRGDGFINSWLLDMSPDGIVYDKSPGFVNTGNINEDDHHETTLNAGKTFYDDQIGITITNVRPDGANGITFDFLVGKKPGMTSGVYDTNAFNQQTGP